MATERTGQGAPEPDGADAERGRQPRIPRPPTREELDEISREQALITDEWGDERPPETSPEKPATG